MRLNLDGKVAVVTGASRGIGLAIARTLAEEGARVVGGARSAGPELEAIGEAVAVDLSQAGGPEALVARAIELHGGVDVLVNNVGKGAMRADAAAVTDEEWLGSLQLNLLSAVRASRAAIPSMVERGGGAIVSIASVNAFMPDPSGIDYSAGKAALVSFSKSISLAYAKQGIRANVVSPGVTATEAWVGSGGVAEQVAAATGETRDAVLAQVEAQVPIGRLLEPDEVARVVALLASDAGSGTTGAQVVVDGGIDPHT